MMNETFSWLYIDYGESKEGEPENTKEIKN